MNEVENHYGQAGDDTGAGSARDKAAGLSRSASRTLHDTERAASEHLRRTRKGAEAFVTENPIMIGVAGLAAGLLVGALLPSTRRENRTLGPYADEFRDQSLRYARELAEQGKHYVEESLERVRTERTGDEPGSPA